MMKISLCLMHTACHWNSLMLMLRNARNLGIQLTQAAMKVFIQLITQKAIMSIYITMRKTIQ